MDYLKAPLERYVEDAASALPAPGGGSVSALAGALGAAMSAMAANFTVGRKKFASVEQEVSDCLQGLEADRGRLLALMEADVEAYGTLSAAYRMPRGSEDEAAARRTAVQAALKEAMEVPLNIMRQCRSVAQNAERLVGIANPNLITDVGVSAILAEAACAAARLNVEVNLRSIKDPALVAEARGEIDEITQQAARCRRQVHGAVQEQLSG